jgi:hypothetical protein
VGEVNDEMGIGEIWEKILKSGYKKMVVLVKLSL